MVIMINFTFMNCVLYIPKTTPFTVCAMVLSVETKTVPLNRSRPEIPGIAKYPIASPVAMAPP